MEILLSKGQICLVDHEDFAVLNKYRWRLHSGGYVVRSERSMTVYMHREIMMPAVGFVVDHKNRNKRDNRRENLRICTQAQNLCNSVKKSPLKYKGVTRDLRNSPKFVSSISVNKKTICLGYFDTQESAALAYDEAAKKYHGEFARLNFV